MDEPDPYSPGFTQAGNEDMYPPHFKGSHNSYDSSNSGNNNGTVGLDGDYGIKSGGTVGM